MRYTEGYSQELKALIGKMCHYNDEKRMTLDELFQEEFFSDNIKNSYAKSISSRWS